MFLPLILVKARHNVWIDRWELNIVDFITQNIEEKLAVSSAILVVISNNSVNSGWCRRELTAGPQPSPHFFQSQNATGGWRFDAASLVQQVPSRDG
jgi:hypothetical protein